MLTFRWPSVNLHKGTDLGISVGISEFTQETDLGISVGISEFTQETDLGISVGISEFTQGTDLGISVGISPAEPQHQVNLLFWLVHLGFRLRNL
jgi:hypothetical protein